MHARTKPRLEINDRFRHALQLMEHGAQNLFITGRAGTGKSTLLSQFCARTKKRPVVLAPTGVAALNVRGQTIHKFFNFYIDVTPDKIRRRQIKPRNPKLYAKLKCIIIDEISMVRADLLDCIDAFLRLYGPDEHAAFGGVQMIFVGDLFQLPPVVSRDSEAIFAEHYETPYFFSAHCLREADFAVVELEKIYRQKEHGFIELLSRIRTSTATDDDLAQLNTRYDPNYRPRNDDFFIHLSTTNRRADEINAAHLASLSAKLHTTNARIEGTFGEEYYPTAPALQFKLGAQIMLITNDTQARWVNGSIGAIDAIARDADDRAYISVRLEDASECVDVYPHTWEVYRYGLEGGEITAEPVGSFTQFPFRLAWAVTIHKAQGKTFEHVIIDLDRGTFAAGQLYVALSRCTTLAGIVLRTPVMAQHMRADERIAEFMDAHPYTPPLQALAVDESLEAELSAAEQDGLRSMSSIAARRILQQLAQGVDPATGAAFAADSPYRAEPVLAALRFALTMRDPRKAKGSATPRATPEGAPNHGKSWSEQERAAVAEAFRENISVKEIAANHGRTRGSIRGELIKQGLITMDDVVA